MRGQQVTGACAMTDARQSGKLLNRNAQQYDIRAAGELLLIRLRAGDYLNTACARAGVAYATAKRWLRLGQGGLGSTWGNYVCREEHVWFAEQVARALAEVEGNAVDAWMAEIERGNWQAARDFLARRFPRRWGNAKRQEPDRPHEAPDDEYCHPDDAIRPSPSDDPNWIPASVSPYNFVERGGAALRTDSSPTAAAVAHPPA